MIALAAILLASSPLSALADGPPPRDGAIAMQEEFDAAQAGGSNAGLILFIARFPDAPLADQARQALAARPRADPAPAPGPDGAIILAFDRARIAGPAALAAFAAANEGHPLAIEALRPFWQAPSRR
ncbi:MAG: hypothetical protein U1E34_07365 [Amaricoccus sp.]